ncbi:MAG: N-acetyltransferase [Pseudomonadota bacterium]
MLDQPPSTVGSPAADANTVMKPLEPCVLHAPADLRVWRDVHLALAATGETVRPEEMAAFAFTRRDDGGVLRAALAGEVVQEALHISHLWVDTPWRRRGLGAELMALAEARGRMAGVRRCHLETRSEAARRFYARRGFQICGEMKNFLGAQSLYFMEKPLG